MSHSGACCQLLSLLLLLQVPPRMQYDPYVLVLVLALWLGGGYIK
jgi:hypothetical protein